MDNKNIESTTQTAREVTPDIFIRQGQYDIQDGLNFDGLSIRLGFIRKVFGIFSLQLLVTIAFIALAYNATMNKLLKKAEYFVSIGCVVPIIILSIFLVKKKTRRIFPLNFILLGIFTFTFGLAVSSLTTLFESQHTLYVGGMLLCTCTTMTLYTLQSKFDLKWYGSLLIAIGTVGISFLAAYFGFPPEKIVVLKISTGVALFLGIYLTVFIHSILSRECCKVNPEDYILVAILAYFSVIAIFLIALAIVGCVLNAANGGKTDCGGGGGHGYFCFYPLLCFDDRRTDESDDEESSVG